jgi:flagella basal body P-ring formation protein FlgA
MLLKDLQTLATKLATGTLFHVEKAGKAYSVHYSALAKAIIEEYADSTVGGSKQSVQAAIGALNSSMSSVSGDVRRAPKIKEYANDSNNTVTLTITFPQIAWGFITVVILNTEIPRFIRVHQNATKIYEVVSNNLYTGEMLSDVTINGNTASISIGGYETGYVIGATNAVSIT